MGPEELPTRVRKILSTEELATFLAKNKLQPCGDPQTLEDRAWRLRDALTKPSFISPELHPPQVQQLLQLLLEVSDIFCIDKEDLRQPADAEAMHIETGECKPIKQRPYKLA